MGTRERIMETALRLFGEQGFARTSIAQIETAAGLSGGSGGLYRHFKSKNELLVTAVEDRLAQRDQLAGFLDPDFSIAPMLFLVPPDTSVADLVNMLCETLLARLEHNRDVTRILFRDNTIDKTVLETFRRTEYEVWTPVLTRGLQDISGDYESDWQATAAVLIGTIAHFWMITDIFDGDHPASVDAKRYLRATAELVAARITDAAGAIDPEPQDSNTIGAEE